MNKNPIKVAYIVPVYNVNKYLDECLNSLAKIKSDKEIILVDDNGSENPIGIIEPYLQNKNFKYIKNNGNLGLGFARNEGIKKISSDITHVYFVDSDDVVDSEEIDIAVSKMNANKTYLMSKFGKYTRTKKTSVSILSDTLSHFPYAVGGSFGLANNVKKTMFKSRTFEDAPGVIDFFNNNPSLRDVEFLEKETYFYRKRHSSIINSKKKSDISIDFINEHIKIHNSKIYGGNFSKTESVFMEYLNIKGGSRLDIDLSIFKITKAQKIGIRFAFFMKKIVFFRGGIKHTVDRDFFN